MSSKEKKEPQNYINQLRLQLARSQNKSYESIFSQIISYLTELKNNGVNISSIESADGYTLAQIYTEFTDLVCLNGILESYKILLSKDDFMRFLIHRSKEGLTIYEISVNVQPAYADYVKLLDLIYSYTDVKILNSLLIGRVDNVFHIAARYNKYYGLLFYYEKIINSFPQSKPLDIQNTSGLTPLHTACFYSNKHIADFLLDLKCEVNPKDKGNETPLHYAAASGNFNLVKKLLINGADKNIKNLKGQLPIDIARNYNFKGITKILDQRFCNMDEVKSIKNLEKDNKLIIGSLTFIAFEGVISWGILGKFSWLKYLLLNSQFFGFLIFCTVIGFKVFGRSCFVDKLKIIRAINATDLIKRGNYYCTEVDNLCPVCKILKEERTQHCLICETCIEEWDHHCYWLGKCINKRNKKYFLLFILLSFICLCQILLIFSVIVYDFCRKEGTFSVIVYDFLKVSSTNIINFIRVSGITVGIAIDIFSMFLLVGIVGQIINLIRERIKSKVKDNSLEVKMVELN